MKRIFLILIFLLIVITPARSQPISRSAISTNAPLANALTRGALYVSAALGSDTNATPGPFATISAANASATNGQTVVVTDGTFNETIYPTPGVSFCYDDGTVNGGQFLITNTPNSNLNIGGMAAVTNSLVGLLSVTGAVVTVGCKSVSEPAALYPITLAYGTSNRIYLNVATTFTGRCFGVTSADATYSNNPAAIFITVGQRFTGAPTTANTIGNSNIVLNVTAPEYLMLSQSGGGPLNTLNKVVFNGGQFSRNGVPNTTVGGFVWFKGVTCQSSNTDATSAIFSGVRGNFWFENERTAINNP